MRPAPVEIRSGGGDDNPGSGGTGDSTGGGDDTSTRLASLDSQIDRAGNTQASQRPLPFTGLDLRILPLLGLLMLLLGTGLRTLARSRPTPQG
jgi:hypothetical protein